MYVPVGTETAERVSPDSDADYACEAFLLRGQSDWNMPEECFDAVLTDEKRKSLFDQYELGYLDDSTAGELTLGGYACPVQDDPCHGRWPDDDDEAWLLLAQATYGFAEISHHGVVFWMIRREDLAARNFENVKLVTQSYL